MQTESCGLLGSCEGREAKGKARKKPAKRKG